MLRRSVSRIKREMERILGDNFLVETVLNNTKSRSNATDREMGDLSDSGIILLIAVFNVVGSLSMLIVEKKEDIRSLQNMGPLSGSSPASSCTKGWLITFIGIVTG